MDDLVDVRCPVCDRDFGVPEPGEIECPCCGWEFVCGDGGIVTDDGDPDREWLFEVKADGDLDAEGLLAVTCTSCGCIFEVGEAGVTPCPRCRRTLDVDDRGQVVDGTVVCLACPRCHTVTREARATLTGHCPSCGHWFDWWDEEDLWDEFWADLEGEDSGCPNCGCGVREENPYTFARCTDGRLVCLWCDWVSEPRWSRDFPGDEPEADWYPEAEEGLLAPGLRPQDRGGHPRTHRVAADGTGDFTRIQDAINGAWPGATILIRPGRYDEQLVLTKVVEIAADGPAGSVCVVSVGGPCLRASPERAEVRGLSFAQTGSGPGVAVEVEAGRLLLEECSITASGLAAVRVSRPFALPVLRRCCIQDGAQVGVLVTERSLATLQDCRISGQGAAGVEVITGGRLRLRRCQVRDNGAEGVCVRRGGEALLQDSVLAGSGAANMEVEGGRVRLKCCEVSKGHSGGVIIREGSAALAECLIRGNARAGVTAGPLAWVLLGRCRLCDGGTHGTLVAGRGLVLLEDSELAGSRQSGLTVRGGGSACLVRCGFAGNGAADVALQGGAALELRRRGAHGPRRVRWEIDPDAVLRLGPAEN
jgi:hypothetical protein